MAETSLPWSGVSVGDAGPYSDDNWSDMYRKLFQYDRTIQAPILGYANELIVTCPAATIRVDTGAALVDGKFYENTASVSFGPLANATYNVVLRKDFVAQTVRLAYKVGAATQTDGTIWEVSIATVVITGGAGTVTDARKFVALNSSPNILHRQGGSAANWDTVGATNYLTNGVIIQVGAIHHTFGAVDTVTFPVPFSDIPLVIPVCNNSLAHIATAEAATKTGFQAYLYTNAGVDVAGDMNWLAIGPA
jgi:hypothetical protein